MEQLPVFALLLLAIAVGWGLGRVSRRGSAGGELEASAAYYHSLRFLLSEQPSTAIEEFMTAIPVTESSLDTHLSLARLMRSKGELEAATRIHQNLLTRPEIARERLHQVHLELAKDYISAGLHDRAERLLRELLAESPDSEEEALGYLQHIYQSERDWQAAIAVAERRLPKRGWLIKQRSTGGVNLARSLSHYYCERADELVAEGALDDARQCLEKAREHDAGNARAAMNLAKLLLAKQPEYSLNLLHDTAEQQPAFAVDILPLFIQAFDYLPGSPSHFGALQSLAESTGSSSLHIKVAEHLDEAAARDYLRAALDKRTTLKLLMAILERQPNLDDIGAMVVDSLQQLCAARPSYSCHHCGFSGRKQHWQCPSCEQWGTIAPIRGSQGD